MNVDELIKQASYSRYPAAVSEVAAHNLCNPHNLKTQRYRNEEYVIETATHPRALTWSVNNNMDTEFGKCEITDPTLLHELTLIVGKQAALHAAHHDKLQAKLAAVNELLRQE